MMYELAVKATVILGAAYAVAAMLAARSAAARHAVWTASLAALLLMPAAALLMPAWSPAPGLVFAVSALAGGEAGPDFATTDLLVRVWYAGIFLVLARLGFSHLLLWRSVRRGERVGTPMTWGILRPVVLVPAGGADATVLRHEQAHVERRDGVWLLVAQVACAVYWFHPLVWMAARRSAEERERACDDRVLADSAALDYADALLACARAASSAAAISATDALESRLRAILDPRTDRSAVSRRFVAATAALAIVVLMPLAACRSTEAYKVSEVDAPPKLVSKTEPEYTQQARDAKLAGTCALSVVVGADGRAGDIKVVRKLDPGLDANAIAAVEKWRFEPGRRNGKAVPVRATIEVNFKLL